MKKVLLGTSAIALAGAFVTPAAAAEWDVSFGGYMEQYVAFASTDYDDDRSGDWDGVDAKQDAEIHFKPSITLDNGIKIGVDIQLEGNTSGDQIDESFLFIRGSFGEILLGNENSAGYKMSYAAPDVTFVGVNSGSLGSFIPFSNHGDDIFRGTLGSTFLENATNNDAARITYFSPRFAGFQLGVSYARDGNDDSSGQVDTDEENHDFIDVGANYVNSFGDANIAISGRYGIADAPDSGDNPEVWAVGANIGFGGFTVGGSYGEQNDAGAKDGEVYDVGVSYETGPWGFSITWIHGENVDNDCGSERDDLASDLLNLIGEDDVFTATSCGKDEELDQFLVGISYKLAKGVSLNAFGAYVDFEEGSPVGEGGEDRASSDDSLDGFVIGTGIKVSF